MQTLLDTSPTSTIRETSFAFFLSLWIKANSTSNLSAIPAALLSIRDGLDAVIVLIEKSVKYYLLAPPASGETITPPLANSGIQSRMCLRVDGSAYKLSTGILKKP